MKWKIIGLAAVVLLATSISFNAFQRHEIKRFQCLLKPNAYRRVPVQSVWVQFDEGGGSGSSGPIEYMPGWPPGSGENVTSMPEDESKPAFRAFCNYVGPVILDHPPQANNLPVTFAYRVIRFMRNPARILSEESGFIAYHGSLTNAYTSDFLTIRIGPDTEQRYRTYGINKFHETNGWILLPDGKLSSDNSKE